MESLQWVDSTYVQKHKSEDPNTLRAMYYPNLRLYQSHRDKTKPMDALFAFLLKYGRKAGISLVIYMLSYVPVVGRLVLPAASFYTFNKAVGPVPATVIFGSGIFLPRRYLIVFLQSYFSSRSLMRELVGSSRKSSSPRDRSADTISTARPLLHPHPFHTSAEEILVPRSRRPPVRLRSRLLHLPENPSSRRPDLRHCGGINSIPDHKDY